MQTEVTVNEDKSPLTVEDLISTTVSAAYWRALATKLESQLDEEIHNNFYVRGLDHVWHESYFDGIE